MASREEIYAAIRNADAAGDAESVQKLAKYLQTMGDQPKQPPAERSLMERGADFSAEARKQAGNLIAGGVRGAGSIGATLLYPIDKATDLIKGDRDLKLSGLITGKQPISRNEERRQAMTDTLTELGADPDSLAFKGGKLGAEVAGTLAVGGLAANGAKLMGASPALTGAIASGGFGGGGNMLVRAAGAGINGAATAGLVDPSEAVKGGAISAALPGAVKVAGMTGNALSTAAKAGARSLMQSAIKPTIAQRSSGDADVAIDTLLEHGLSPTKKGVEKLRELIDQKNTEIGDLIANSTATVDKQKVLDRLDDVRGVFRNQVRPQKDLAAIEGVADDFAAHPQMPLPQTAIPVQKAQELKRGTYKVLQGKYGEAGSAETEAQKGLARGLKEEIAQAVPGVQALNAEESRLIKTLDVAERRALLELNKNPVGLSALAANPIAAAGFMADRSAAFKALAARMINATAKPVAGSGQALLSAAQNPLIRASGVVATSANP